VFHIVIYTRFICVLEVLKCIWFSLPLVHVIEGYHILKIMWAYFSLEFIEW
jgi:hypothetical protein